MHKDTSSNIVHVVDDQLNGQATTYNGYLKTGDPTGSVGSSFTSLVPFASNTNDVATLAALAVMDDSNLNGPAATDRVACLSCHRAHASGWRYALRWNGEAEFLTLADSGGSPVYPGVDAGLGNQGQYNPRLHAQSDEGGLLRPAGDRVRGAPEVALQQVPRQGLGRHRTT